MTKKIDVAIIGAGAIGSTIASFIYKSKYVNNFALVDVNLVHIKEVNNNGLTIIQANGKKNVFSIKIEKDLKCKYDLIILCVKSIATVAVCRKYKNYLKKDGYFLSFQNGINNQNIIDVIGEKKYLAGVVGFGATFRKPGLIEITSKEISCVIGSVSNKYNDNFKNIISLIKEIGDITISSNIIGEQWSKLAINCVTAPLGAIYKLKFGQLVRDRKIRKLIFRILNEVIAVGKKIQIKFTKLGNKINIVKSFKISLYYNYSIGNNNLLMKFISYIVFPLEIFRASLILFLLVLKHGKMESSMWQDLRRKSKTEIDFLNGVIVNEANKTGVNCEINKIITEKVKILENNLIANK